MPLGISWHLCGRWKCILDPYQRLGEKSRKERKPWETAEHWLNPWSVRNQNILLRKIFSRNRGAMCIMQYMCNEWMKHKEYWYVSIAQRAKTQIKSTAELMCSRHVGFMVIAHHSVCMISNHPSAPARLLAAISFLHRIRQMGKG